LEFKRKRKQTTKLDTKTKTKINMKMKILPKICALIAVALMLPALAHAKSGGEKDSKGDQNGQGDLHANKHGNGDDKGGKHGHVPVVPEANVGWVLVPFFGAVLLLSWRQLSRAKA
jgi:hypothetical protein